MSSEASKRVVDETRRLFAGLLAEPLDARQLARPSFRFIQSLVKSLIVEAKILRDVFNPSELDARRSWDRRAKVELVQRLIDFAANNGQPALSCVAARVVTGVEPNKSNELLQSLAKIGRQRLSARNERRPRTFTKLSSAAGPPKRSSDSPAKDSGAGLAGQEQEQEQEPPAPSSGEQPAPAAAASGQQSNRRLSTREAGKLSALAGGEQLVRPTLGALGAAMAELIRVEDLLTAALKRHSDGPAH